MIKVFILMASLVGLLFYFFGDLTPTPTTEQTGKSTAASGLQKLGPLPGNVAESSGIEVLNTKGEYITLNDAGNKAELYQLNGQGKLVETYSLKLPNVDWEDLTKDDKGHLYIADTGNNENDRKELAIYKVSVDGLNDPQAIRFTYEDQKDFPPAKKDRNFDSEALFWHNGHLYVISKDRGLKQTAKVYQLPDKPGTYKAKLVGQADFNGQVTSAAISPDGKLVVLLEEERMHVYKGFKNPAAFYEGESEKINLAGAGQTEAIAFEDNKTLIITSENGSLFRYKL